MPRIRTIKPEFWDSPGTARASLRTRLFFIALWNWADDWGIGTANPKQLMGFAFPNDDDVSVADFPGISTEVAECFGVQWYVVDGRPYFCIPSWDKHQKNERRASKRNPGPDQGFSSVAEMRGISVRTDGKTPIGTGEQGNRGTGEQLLLSDADASDSGTLIPDVWVPNQRHRDLADSMNLDVVREASRFRQHATVNRRRLKNWNTGFTNWLNKGAVMAQQRNGVAPVSRMPSRTESNMDVVRRLEAQQAGLLEVTA